MVRRGQPALAAVERALRVRRRSPALVAVLATVRSSATRGPRSASRWCPPWPISRPSTPASPRRDSPVRRTSASPPETPWRRTTAAAPGSASTTAPPWSSTAARLLVREGGLTVENGRVFVLGVPAARTSLDVGGATAIVSGADVGIDAPGPNTKVYVANGEITMRAEGGAETPCARATPPPSSPARSPSRPSAATTTGPAAWRPRGACTARPAAPWASCGAASPGPTPRSRATPARRSPSAPTTCGRR